jgi:chemotaxis protein methyltransferase WspC
MSDPWKAIERKLAEWIGLNPGTVGSTLIARAVKLRMNELRLAEVEAYASLLGRSDAEVEALIEEVVIPESWFFRDATPFRMLQEYVQGGWVSNPARPPLRVLSIPCAAGEEPYSIAMVLFEIGLSAARFSVDAVDISARRLEQARLGIYSPNAFRGSDSLFRDRYFRQVAQGFELETAIRDRVRFFRASILDPFLLKGEARYDVLFCRNLLIYLHDAPRATVIAAINRLLVQDGLLFIGHADRLGQTEGVTGFAQFGDRGAFAYRRTAGASRLPDPLPGAPALVSPSSGSARTSTVPEETSPRQEPRTGANASPGSRAQQRSAPLQPEAETNTPRPGPAKEVVATSEADCLLLEQAAKLANNGMHARAIAACQRSIKLEGPTGAAYYLMGMIYRSMGDPVRGDESFAKAVYLDPAHDEALLALALSAERRGDLLTAAGFRRRAERAALKKGARST